MQEFFGFRNFRQFERTRREIKLPYDLLNNLGFRQLPDAYKAHLICLLLLSARMNNLLPNSPAKLERLIGATEPLDLNAFADFVDFARVETPTWQDRVANRRVPDSMRATVLVRDGGRCRKCRRCDQPGNGSHCSRQQRRQDRRGEFADPVPTLQPGQVQEAGSRVLKMSATSVTHPAALRSSWPDYSCANLSPRSRKTPSGWSRPRRCSPLQRSGARIRSPGNTGAGFSSNTKNWL